MGCRQKWGDQMVLGETALCLPEELSSSGPFSGPAALSPLRLGCG